MLKEVLHTAATFLDLAALTAFIGASWCSLFLVRPTDEDAGAMGASLARLRTLIVGCLSILVLSSIASLFQRSMEMSASGISEVFPVLSIVLFKTHYGSMWQLRTGGLIAAWVVWLGGSRLVGPRLEAILLSSAGAVIAFARSATGHPSDFGDFSPQQLGDWIHLMSGSVWAGALFALAIVFPPSLLAADRGRCRLVAGVADRFYVSFGPTFALLVMTGLYGAWFSVGSLMALATTPYGALLSAKLILFLTLTLRYMTPPQQGRDENLFALSFLRRTRAEAMIALGILLSVSVLVHQIPARHQMHLSHTGESGSGHGSHMHKDPEGPQPVVSLVTIPSSLATGTPVAMEVRIRKPDGRPLEGLTLSHTRMLHAVIVSEDLDVFAHIHPEDLGPVTPAMMQNSAFPLSFRFPKSGEYLIGFDFAAGEDFFSKTVGLTVSGAPKMGPPKVDLSRKKTFGEYEVSLAVSPERPKAGEETAFHYVITRGGKAVTTLEPYLGASMHLAVVPVGLKGFIHAHGTTPGEAHRDHLHTEPPGEIGPEIEAEVVFPLKGTYKIFSEVQHRGTVLLFDFMVEVH